MRSVVNIVKEPRDELYHCLIDMAVDTASETYVIVRRREDLNEAGVAELDKLSVHQIDIKEVSSWPGTQLYGGKATMLTYRMSPEVGAILKTAANGLYDWSHPDHPEDLGFFRADGSLWLASISHEMDAFFELSQDERRDLVKYCPLIADMIADASSEQSD